MQSVVASRRRLFAKQQKGQNQVRLGFAVLETFHRATHFWVSTMDVASKEGSTGSLEGSNAAFHWIARGSALLLHEQAAEGPHTPQQAAPQQSAQTLRFGTFEEQDVASGFASPPRATPPVRLCPRDCITLSAARGPPEAHRTVRASAPAAYTSAVQTQIRPVLTCSPHCVCHSACRSWRQRVIL